MVLHGKGGGRVLRPRRGSVLMISPRATSNDPYASRFFQKTSSMTNYFKGCLKSHRGVILSALMLLVCDSSMSSFKQKTTRCTRLSWPARTVCPIHRRMFLTQFSTVLSINMGTPFFDGDVKPNLHCHSNAASLTTVQYKMCRSVIVKYPVACVRESVFIIIRIQRSKAGKSPWGPAVSQSTTAKMSSYSRTICVL